jgi:hypothetical protein
MKGQEKLLEYDFSFLKELPDRVYTIPDKDPGGFFTLFSCKDTSIKLRIDFTKSPPIINSLPNILKKEFKLITGRKLNNVLLESYQIGNGSYVFTKTDLSDGKMEITNYIDLEKNEEFVTALPISTGLLFLSYKTKSNKLFIYKKSIDDNVNKETMEIVLPQRLAMTDEKPFSNGIELFSDQFKGKHFTIMENNFWYPVGISSLKRKIYQGGDELVFCINAEELRTFLIAVDYNKYTYKIVEFKQDEKRTSHNNPFASSSFVKINNLLVTSHIVTDSLKIKIFNAQNGEELKAINITADNYNELIQSGFIKIGDILNADTVKSISFKKFLDYCDANELGISGYELDNKLHLTIGSNYKRATIPKILLSVAITAGSTYAINSVPNTIGFGVVYFYEVNSKNTVSFQLSLSANDFSPLEDSSENQMLVWKKILDFANDKHIGTKDVNLFLDEKYYYLGWVNKKEKKYFIYRFPLLNGN